MKIVGNALFEMISSQDVNDIPPVFTLVPKPITLDDDVPIGTPVTTLIATDSDGTSPNNKVSLIISFVLMPTTASDLVLSRFERRYAMKLWAAGKHRNTSRLILI